MPTKVPTNPPVSPSKYRFVLGELRRRITAGESAPGSKLPTRRDLSRQLAMSPVTLQRALDQLIGDGFIVARGKRGTFVADHPPHLGHYALLLPDRHDAVEAWSHFHTVLADQAQQMQKSIAPRRISLFYSITGRVDAEDYQTLLGYVIGERLAGMILAVPPHLLADTPLFDQKDTPCVAVMSRTRHEVLEVIPDMESFNNRALDLLAGQGRKRVALLSSGVKGEQVWERFAAGCAQRGMTTHPRLVQFIQHWPHLAPRHAAQALLHGPVAERPDGLIIEDDHLVEQATAGVLASGVAVPAALTVVAHCNFPQPKRGSVPITYLGFDARELLIRCMDTIDRQRAGGNPAHVALPAVFEDELTKDRQPRQR